MLSQVNVYTFNMINQFAGSNILLDKIMIITAKYLPLIFVLFLLLLWFSDIKTKNIVLYSTYSAILGIVMNFFIGLFYFHPRPFMENIGHALINHIPDTSFPSDHTTFMLSIAFMLLYFKKTRKVGIALSVLGLFGGISRIFCGVHYPIDILGSVIVAIISSYVIFLSESELQKINKLLIELYNKVLNWILN